VAPVILPPFRAPIVGECAMSRFRTKGQNMASCYWHHSNGVSCVIGDKPLLYDAMTDELSTYINPRPVNSCSHTKVTASVIREDILMHSQYGTSVYNPTITWRLCDSVTPSDSWDGSSEVQWSELTVGLADQVYGLVRSKAQLCVSLYEARKTWRMIRNPFSLLRKDWRHIAKTSTCRDLAKRGANLWLEANYGWKPLLYDVKNLADSCGRFARCFDSIGLDRSTRRCGNRATYSYTLPPPTISDNEWTALISSTPPYMYYGEGNDYPYRFVFDKPIVYACVGCVVRDQMINHASRLRRALSNFGCDPSRDLLPTLWEIVPFSFVVDWFVNTDAIMALPRLSQAKARLDQVGVSGLCYSVKTVGTYRLQVIPVFSYQMYYADGWWNWQQAQTSSSHSVMTGTPGIYSKYLRSVGFPPDQTVLFSNRGLTVSNVITGLSLITQRWK